jgi:hypothetical protein
LRGALVLVSLITLLVSTIGCTTGEVIYLMALLAPDVAMRKGFGTSGSDTIDAILDAKDVIDNINAADNLMKQGREKDDLNLMEQAIEKRPGDWRYRVSAAALALQQGQLSVYDEQTHAATGLTPRDQMLPMLNMTIYELEGVKNHFSDKPFKSGRQCRELYGELANNYSLRSQATGKPSPMAEQYAAQAQECPP